MPYDGNGTFVHTNGTFSGTDVWAQDAAAGTKIITLNHDNSDNDICDGLSNCVTRDGQSPATANLPMGGFRHTGVGNAAARTDYAAAGQVQDSSLTYAGIATGTGDAIVAALTPAITAIATGMLVHFVTPGTANTAGDPTLNLNSLGAVVIKAADGSTLSPGALPANTAVLLQAGASFWNLLFTRSDGFVSGDVKIAFATQTGWQPMNGRTIGNASSNATGRANADTSALYSYNWTNNSTLLIYDSAGVLTTRGASAAADFAANKALAMPNFMGRVPVGQEAMGGASTANISQVTTNLTTNGTTTATVASAAQLTVGMYIDNSNITAGTTISGISGTTLTLSGAASGSGTTSARFSQLTDAQSAGAIGGSQTHVLSTEQLASHPHAGTSGQFAMNFNQVVQSGVGASVPALADVQAFTASAGSNQPHPNMQPSLVVVYLQKL